MEKKHGEITVGSMIVAESKQESDSQIWRTAGPGFKNLGTGAESESEKVTPATSALNLLRKIGGSESTTPEQRWRSHFCQTQTLILSQYF